VPRLSDNIGGLPTADQFDLAVSQGRYPGYSRVRLFGRNDDVDAGTEEMWEVGTARVLPTSAGVAVLVSDDVNDTAAGTGARAVQIIGLDINYNPLSEIVVTDGTTNVSTIAEFFRVNTTLVVSSGASQMNDGNLSVSIGGDLQSFIEAQEALSHQTHYTVRAGFTFFINAFDVNTGRTGAADIVIETQFLIFGTNTWLTASALSVYEGSLVENFMNTGLPEKSEIRQQIMATGGSNFEADSVLAGFLVDNTKF